METKRLTLWLFPLHSSPALRRDGVKRMSALVAGLLLSVLILLQAPPTVAQNPPIYSPVILTSWQDMDGNWENVQMTESGKGIQRLTVTGDLTHNGVIGGRYFLTIDASAHLLSYDEKGARPTVLTSDPQFVKRYFARWSPDGTRILHQGRQVVTVDGAAFEQDCLVVGEVVSDAAGAPVFLDNERCAINLTTTHPSESLAAAVWTSDNDRVVYQTVYRASGYEETRMYVAAVPRSATTAISDVRIVIAEPTQAVGGLQWRWYPATSPVSGDHRLAYWRYRNNGGMYRWDLFVVSVPPDYAGEPLPAQAIVTNITEARALDWSPDGKWLAYSALASGFYHQIFKISVQAGKITALTSNKDKRDYGFAYLRWRP